jgi:hypothetical protein
MLKNEINLKHKCLAYGKFFMDFQFVSHYSVCSSVIYISALLKRSKIEYSSFSHNLSAFFWH